MRVTLTQALKVAVTVFLAALVVSEALIYAPLLANTETFAVDLTITGANATGTDHVRVGSLAHFHQTFFERTAVPSVTHLFYYFDSAYASSWASTTAWFGLSQHLATVASLRGLPIAVSVVDATQLAALVSTPPAAGSALVMASGVFPDTVFTNSTNIVTPWIEAGGLLIWIGDRIGYYSAVPHEPLKYPSPANPANAGTNQFINYSYFGGTVRGYLNATTASTDFGVNYSLGLPGDALNLTWINGIGGLAVGPVAGAYTNVAIVPKGSGAIVYFGGPNDDDNEAAAAMINVLQSGIAQAPSVLVTSLNLTVPPGSHSYPFVFSTQPYPYSPNGSLVCSFAYQSDFSAAFAAAACAKNA
jgi:hypothetical protein